LELRNDLSDAAELHAPILKSPDIEIPSLRAAAVTALANRHQTSWSVGVVVLALIVSAVPVEWGTCVVRGDSLVNRVCGMSIGLYVKSWKGGRSKVR